MRRFHIKRKPRKTFAQQLANTKSALRQKQKSEKLFKKQQLELRRICDHSSILWYEKHGDTTRAICLKCGLHQENIDAENEFPVLRGRKFWEALNESAIVMIKQVFVYKFPNKSDLNFVKIRLLRREQ